LRGGVGGQVLREHSDKVSRIVVADSDTCEEREPVQFLGFANCIGAIVCNLNLVTSYMGGRVSLVN
jgi:hypothetical protein